MIQFFVTWTANFTPIWLLFLVAGMYADKKESSKSRQALFLLSFSFIATLINQLHIPVLNAAVSLALFIGVILLLFHILWYNAVLLAGFVWCITAFAETIASVVWSSLIGVRLTAAFFAEDMVMIVAQSITSLSILIIFSIFRAIFQRKKDENKLPQNLAVVLFPIASAFTAYYILSTIVDVFSRQTAAYMGVFLAVFLVAINVASLIGNENVRKRYILQNEIDAMQRQEELTVGLLRQQEEHLREMRTQAHDFKNHLLCLRVLAGDNPLAQNQSRQYIDELLETVDNAEQFVDVRNEALRAILANTAGACKAQGIEFRCRIDHSDFSFMPFSDISSLFSNALSNAVEACALCDGQSTPFIDLKILRKGEMLFIQLTNSKFSDIRMQDGAMRSTKTEPEKHGIGFKNMSRAVQRNGGNITADHDDSEFRLYITLPLNDVKV